MAERERNSGSGTPPTSSSLDESRHPLGSPLGVCARAGEPKYRCSHSRILLQEDLQNFCRNPSYTACLTWIIRNSSNPICQGCKAEDSGLAREENLLSEEKGLSTAAINKEVPGSAVHCGIPGCSWMGALTNLENPSRLSSSDEDCRFSSIGCPFKGNAGDQKVHEKNAAGRHLLLLLQYVKHLKASSSPRGSQPSSPLIDAKLWMNGPLSLQIQDPGGDGPFSALPVEEGEVSWCTLLRRVKRVSWLESKLQVFENITSVLSKEMTTSRQKILAFRGQRGLDQDMIRGLELKIADLQRCLVQKDATLTRLEKRLHSSEQASYDGVFLWKITDIHQKCYEAICGKINSFQSPAFYTSRYGYKLCMRIYLNGEGRGRGTHISLFIVLLKGDYDALLPWPFTHKITFMLLSQDNGDHLVTALHPDPTSASFQRPGTDMNEANGFARFVPLAKLQSPKYTYLKEGTLFLKCIVETSS
ncbi:TNF receptor-associated factor 1 isoform 2-T2 [Liasis olivaceus]